MADRKSCDGESSLQHLSRKHATEVASLQAAFHARLAAREEELAVGYMLQGMSEASTLGFWQMSSNTCMPSTCTGHGPE